MMWEAAECPELTVRPSMWKMRTASSARRWNATWLSWDKRVPRHQPTNVRWTCAPVR